MNNTAIDFKNKLENVSAWAVKKNIDHVYKGGIGCFDNMPKEHQVLAATGLSQYFDFIQSTDVDVELDYTNTSQFLKAALLQLGWKLQDGLLDRILPTDYVEIYSNDMVPAFKSLNFWGSCSYTLDELYTYPYSELFARDEFYQASLNRSAEKIFTQKESLIENPVPEHVAWETRGPYKRQIKYKFFTAVYAPDNSMVGGMVVSDVKPLSS
jgi:hypothetical protein